MILMFISSPPGLACPLASSDRSSHVSCAARCGSPSIWGRIGRDTGALKINGSGQDVVPEFSLL